MSIPDRPVALVTGATRGLGRAIAEALAPDHLVLVGGRDSASIARVVAELPHAAPFLADLTDAWATGHAVRECLVPLGRLDVLVHNAGVARRGTVADTPRETWRWMLDTDVVAVADLTRLALPLLRSSRGTVVVVNSGAGLRGYAGDAPYCAAKWALRGFTEALREEERGRVRVTSLHPGRIDTDMQRDLQARVGRPYDTREHMDPADVARAVRLAVDLPVDTGLDEVRIRPVRTLH